MAGGCDEVEKGVNAVIAETRITLDAGLFGNDIVVLSLEVANDLAKRRLVVNLITKARSVDNG